MNDFVANGAGAAMLRSVDWNAVRQDYEGGEGTLDEIARRHGITRSALSWRVKSQLWRMRNMRVGASGPSILARIYRLLERQVFQLEKQKDPMNEKDAAALSKVAATLEKLMEIERFASKPAKATPPSKDFEVLRKKVAERFAELSRR